MSNQSRMCCDCSWKCPLYDSDKCKPCRFNEEHPNFDRDPYAAYGIKAREQNSSNDKDLAMSHNLCVKASGMVISPSGHKFKFEEAFNLRQTPTEVTRQVLAAEDKVERLFTLGYYPTNLSSWLKTMQHLGFDIIWYST